MEIAQQLSEVEIKTPHENGRRMCSVLILLCLLWKVPHFIKYFAKCDDLSGMFSMLYMKPQQSTSKQWTLGELTVLKNFIPNRYYAELSDCLVDCINFVITKRHILDPQWLFVLPLVHIFKGMIEPVEKFDEVKTISDSSWDDKYVKLPPNSRTSAVFSNKSR